MRTSLFAAAMCGFVFVGPVRAQEVDVAPTVDAWQAKTKIIVTPAATQKLGRTIADPYSGISKLGVRPVDREESQWIVDSYLYEVRDKTCPLSKCKSAITEGNLDQVKFGLFASSIVTSSIKPGRLVVNSLPDGATIQIDKTPKGQTNKTFVMSPGDHAVEITINSGLRCQRSVTISSGETTAMSCPERGKPQ
jgi:PEGA domain